MQVFLALLTLAASTLAHISIINPNGFLAYKTGETITITWNNFGYDIATPVAFELADASKGMNKVSSIGVILVNSTTIGELQVTTTIPAGVPNGPAYCVRSNIRGKTGFEYYFSPTFPIGMALSAGTPAGTGSSGNAPAPSASAGAAQVSPAVTSKPSSAVQLNAVIASAGLACLYLVL